jgi:hypothetical protein
MPFEYTTDGGVLRVLGTQCQWTIEFNGRRCGQWVSLDDAATAAARHMTGLRHRDNRLLMVSDELSSWRPIGDNL